jgi:hypothetical protein
MKDRIIAWASWHPTKGFDEHAYEGPVAYADHDVGLLDDIKDLNETDGTNSRDGWRMVKVEIRKLP